MRIEQEARYVGDRWHWAVWIEGHESELDQVEAVEYTLHETFPEPVQRVRDRAAKFRLESYGWGEFEINAHAFTKDGSAQHLKHWLELTWPDGKHAPGKSGDSRRKLLVSYAAADAPLGEALRDALVNGGFDAVTMDDLFATSVGSDIASSWSGRIRSALDDVDVVVGIFSDATSGAVARELLTAQDQAVDVLAVVIGKEQLPSALVPQTKFVRLDSAADLDDAVSAVMAMSR